MPGLVQISFMYVNLRDCYSNSMNSSSSSFPLWKREMLAEPTAVVLNLGCTLELPAGGGKF